MTGRKKPNSAVKAVMKLLDGAAKKYGMLDARRAANRWSSAQADKVRLAKQRAALERELAEVTSRLNG